MPRPSSRIWIGLETVMETKIPLSVRRRYEDEFSMLELDLILTAMPDYIAQYPASANSPSMINTLGKMIRSGEWERVPTEEPVALRTPSTPMPPAPTHSLVPVGFIPDPLLARMPTLIQCIVESRLEGTGICVDFGIAGAIAMIAACCGNRLRFRAWGDEHNTNIYLVLVGETGKSFKSSVLKRVKSDLSLVDARNLAADEGSIEALIKDLAEWPARLWIRDEFAGLLAAIKGVDYLKPVRELLLSLYDHAGVYRRRLTKGEWICTDPALSFLASIQPSVMGEELFSGRNVDSGFVNRLLLVPGDGVFPYWPTIQEYGLLRGGITERLKSLSRQPITVTDASSLAAPAQYWDGREREIFGEYGPYVARRAALQALKLATLLEAADDWPRGRHIADKWLSVAMELLERWYFLSVAVIADVHIRQPGERDRRDFFEMICHTTHNNRGPQLIGVLAAEAQISKRKADEYQSDLVSRGWISEGDDQAIMCTRQSQLCEARQANEGRK